MATYLDELVQRITTKADLKGFDDLDKKQKRARKENDLLARSFRNAFGMFLGIQGFRSIVETSRKFDLMQKSLQGLTKSAEDFKYLRQEAYRTGTDLLNIAGAYKNFYSAATGVGFGRGAVQGMFSDVLTAGRGIGASQEQIKAALLALEQMLSKGKVSAQELRLQMGNALPGAFEIAARSMNMTTAELDALMSAGKLASTEFVPRFTAQLKRELGQGFEANIKSLDFALVNLSTAWQEFQAQILQGEAGEALADLVRQVTSILRSQSLLNFVKLIGKGLGIIIKNLKWILIWFGMNKIAQYIASIKKLHWAIWELATSTKLAGTSTKILAEGYALLTSGQVIKGLSLLRTGLWGLVAPTLVLAAKFALIVGAILMIQDLLLTFADPNADTYTRDLIKGLDELKRKGEEVQTKLLIEKFQKQDPNAVIKVSPTGGIYETAPGLNLSYNPLPNSIGNYSNATNNRQENSIAINIYPQRGQSESDIGEAVALKLGDILDNYVMVT